MKAKTGAIRLSFLPRQNFVYVQYGSYQKAMAGIIHQKISGWYISELFGGFELKTPRQFLICGRNRNSCFNKQERKIAPYRNNMFKFLKE